MREWWRAHVTARPSTLVLSAVFVATLVVYFLVRPDPTKANNEHSTPQSPAPPSSTPASHAPSSPGLSPSTSTATPSVTPTG